MYLFERILLCCKEANPNKQKAGKKQTPVPPDRRVKPRLVLSGRIFMQNVTETISVAKPGRHDVLLTGDLMVVDGTRQDPTRVRCFGRETMPSSFSS